jgi:Tfp pilus assembly protein PilF
VNPKSAFCQYNYGFFLESTGRKEEAGGHYREALKWGDFQTDVDLEMIRRKVAEIK